MTLKATNNDITSADILQYAQSKWLKMYIDTYVKGNKKQIDGLDNLYKGLTQLSIEDAKSLLFIELTLSGNFSMLIHHDNDDFKNLLAFEIRKYQNPIQRFNLLIDNKIKTILPEAYVAWFKNDLRASLYLAGLIEEMLKSNRVTKKGREELLIYIRDYLRLSTLDYTKHIKNIPHMKHMYNQNSIVYKNGNWTIGFILSLKDLYLNNTTPNKKVRWIDSTNDDQIQYIYDRMADQNTLILKQNFFPNSTEEMYILILASLDSLSNQTDIESKKNKNISTRDLVLNLLEKSWKAKDCRAEKSESGIGHNIKIYQKNEDKLKKLVQYQNITANKLLNRLVENEYDKFFNEKSSPI